MMRMWDIVFVVAVLLFGVWTAVCIVAFVMAL